MPTKDTVDPKGYIGKYKTFWNYVNSDSGGVHTNTCCGQAAVYSAYRTMMDFAQFKGGFGNFVRQYPPNNLFGTLGSSPQRVLEIMRALRFKPRQGSGENGLRNELKRGPVIVCQDVGAAGWNDWGLHWTCVFGYTPTHYYLTQWGRTNFCSREHFLKGWNTALTTIASNSSNRYYVPF